MEAFLRGQKQAAPGKKSQRQAEGSHRDSPPRIPVQLTGQLPVFTLTHATHVLCLWRFWFQRH